jgi:hypothetical protein
LNPRLEKIYVEIEKVKRKLTDYQNRLRDLERLKTELENGDIISLVRGIDIPFGELSEIARIFKERRNCVVPDLEKTAQDKMLLEKTEPEGSDIEK